MRKSTVLAAHSRREEITLFYPNQLTSADALDPLGADSQDSFAVFDLGSEKANLADPSAE